jgi:hypothetical protein
VTMTRLQNPRQAAEPVISAKRGPLVMGNGATRTTTVEPGRIVDPLGA